MDVEEGEDVDVGKNDVSMDHVGVDMGKSVDMILNHRSIDHEGVDEDGT